MCVYVYIFLEVYLLADFLMLIIYANILVILIKLCLFN